MTPVFPQRMTESLEKKQRRTVSCGSRVPSAQPFQGGLHPIPQLQRMLGNQRVAQLIQAKRLTPDGKIIGLQPKQTVGAADDRYEQESDRVADEATRMPENTAFSGQQSAVSELNALLRMKPGRPFAKGPARGEEEVLQKRPIAISPLVQRQVEEEEEERIQTRGEPDGAPFLIPTVGSSIASLRGGLPRSESERTFFEPRFGHDSSQVRLHTDGQAGTLAKTVHAKAFTVDRDVFFSQGGYSPGSSEGRGFLAHELAHVIQQERGPESKRDMDVPAPLRRAQDRTVPSSDVIMRKVKTSSAAVLSAFQALCPSAMFTSGQGGFIAGRGCAGVNTSQTTCKCLCYAVTNRSLYSFDVSMASWSSSWPYLMYDWSWAFPPMPSVWPHSEPVGSAWSITLPSDSSPGVFGAFDPSGNCIPCRFERLLAHEICGHAVPRIGNEERGDRESHNLPIQFENAIAQEQGWPARGSYSDANQGESYSQESGDPKIVYKLKDGWHYQTCTPPPQAAPGQEHPRRRRRRRKRSSMHQQKITNTENVRLVSEPIHWANDAFLIERLPKGTSVEVLDKGAGEPFNQETALEYQWWWVRAEGKEGWVMQVLLDDVTGSP